MSEPEASLAKGMILGYKKEIPSELKENFSKAGLSHIIAISGLHIGIISAILLNSLFFFGFSRKQAFYFVCFMLFLYLILIGAPSSAMRASLMGFLVLLAMHIGRLNRLGHALMLSAGLLVFINPKILRDDVGFQLSFLAVLGIAYLYPFFRKKIKRRNVLIDIFLISVSVQIFTLPIMIYNFKTFSFVSPISNLFILPVLPILLVLLIIALIISVFLPSLSFIFFAPAQVVLFYIVKIAEIFSFGAVSF